MAKISGILTDGAGQIINDCTIELYAKKTTSKVLTQTQAFKVANNGSYSMNVLPCEYDVSLIINGFPKKQLGSIQVFSDSIDGTLNDFLLNPSESEITPLILQQIVDARNEAKQAASNSSLSEKNSKTSEINSAKSAQAANVSETNSANSAKSANDSSNSAKTASIAATDSANAAKTSADSANKSAAAASVSAKNASESANSIKTSETNAKTSANAAAKSADDAKSWASTVDTSTFVKKAGDNLTGDLSINGKSVLKDGDAVRLFGDLLDKSLNTLDGSAEGIYFQGKNILATSENGYPVNQAGSLNVIKNGADGAGCCQIYTTYRSARQFIRNYRGGTKTWEPWIEQITTANVSADIVGALPAVKTVVNNTPTYMVGSHVVFKDAIGDQRLMPFRRDELPFGWYFRNGDNYLLSSPQGQVLNGLSINYKNDHRITIKTINGQQYINVPTAFSADGRGFFERAVDGATRQVGSVEDDAIREIWGHFDTGVVTNHYKYAQGVFSGVDAVNPENGGAFASMQAKTYGYNFNASRVVPTANENRPLNIGMTPVIYLGV